MGVVITGKGSGDGLRVADVSLVTVEQEASAAHTVSYTTAMSLLATLAAALGGDSGVARQIEALPDQLAVLLGQESWEELAARFKDRRCYYFIGGGPNTATAYEAALKMNEANHRPTVGMNCEQFMHGPWASIGPEDLLVVVAPPGPSYERVVMAARAVREVGTPILAIVQDGDTEMTSLAAESITLPEVDELLSPILAVVPLQLLTYHLALLFAVNPDTMRGDQPAHGRARKRMEL
jgi:glutamine---fructose-6-phosphate transaminase (isomerizing)